MTERCLDIFVLRDPAKGWLKPDGGFTRNIRKAAWRKSFVECDTGLLSLEFWEGVIAAVPQPVIYFRRAELIAIG